jgi:hypothetical protein
LYSLSSVAPLFHSSLEHENTIRKCVFVLNLICQTRIANEIYRNMPAFRPDTYAENLPLLPNSTPTMKPIKHDTIERTVAASALRTRMPAFTNSATSPTIYWPICFLFSRTKFIRKVFTKHSNSNTNTTPYAQRERSTDGYTFYKQK